MLLQAETFKRHFKWVHSFHHLPFWIKIMVEICYVGGTLSIQLAKPLSKRKMQIDQWTYSRRCKSSLITWLHMVMQKQASTACQILGWPKKGYPWELTSLQEEYEWMFICLSLHPPSYKPSYIHSHIHTHTTKEGILSKTLHTFLHFFYNFIH